MYCRQLVILGFVSWPSSVAWKIPEECILQSFYWSCQTHSDLPTVWDFKARCCEASYWASEVGSGIWKVRGTNININIICFNTTHLKLVEFIINTLQNDLVYVQSQSTLSYMLLMALKILDPAGHAGLFRWSASVATCSLQSRAAIFHIQVLMHGWLLMHNFAHHSYL